MGSTCKIPITSASGILALNIEKGDSIVFVGANGAGKTRLAVYLENKLPVKITHRIAAQKSLTMIDEVPLTSLARAMDFLRYGHDNSAFNYSDEAIAAGMKTGGRWGSRPAVHLLNDFEALLRTLFAEQTGAAVRHLKEHSRNPNAKPPATKVQILKSVWDKLLPHRELDIQETSVRVSIRSGNTSGAYTSSPETYAGSQMSDGERAIFYFLGQCLLAPDNGILLIDEPESHIHKAILNKLWDSIESLRPDCAFVYITHDLDFAVERPAVEKFFVRSYSSANGERWDIETLPDNTGLPEHVVAEIVGSRKSALFVEGEGNSLDLAIYRGLYSNFTIIPVGSCESVIHSVSSYRSNTSLHKLGSVRGLVDADDRGAAEVSYLKSKDVYVLPVAEVENLLLTPDVFLALAEALYCKDPSAVLERLKADAIEQASKELDMVCARYTMRRIDRSLKEVDVAAKDCVSLQTKFTAEISNINPTKIFLEVKGKIKALIDAGDLSGLLAFYDNKGLLARSALLLGLRSKNDLQDKISRLLGDPNGSKLRDELTKLLPTILA